jgi:hypothetical protein
MLRPNILFHEPKKNDGAPLLTMTVPLTLRYIIKPGDSWMIEPYVGVIFNAPLSDKLSLPVITPSIGVQIGAKMATLGAFFFSVEFDYDSDVTYRFGNNEAHVGPRMQMFLGIGIKFGFFNRRVQTDET